MSRKAQSDAALAAIGAALPSPSDSAGAAPTAPEDVPPRNHLTTMARDLNTTPARDFNTTRAGDVRRTVFLPRSTWIRLRRMSVEHGVTTSSLVRKAVIAWLDGPTGDGGG